MQQPTTAQRPRKTTRARYLTALAITASVAIAQFFVLSDEIYARRQQTQVVVLASGQRTLAVEIASLASAYVDANSDERPDVRERLAADVDSLLRGEAELTDPTNPRNPRGWPPPSVRDLFAASPFDVSLRTREFAGHAARLLASPPRSLLRSNDDLIYLANVGSDLAYRYHAVVSAYIDVGEAEQRAMLWHEAIALAALLLTLGLELPLIFRPMEAELERYVRQLVSEASKIVDTERTAQLGTWEVDVRSGTVAWSSELRRIYGLGTTDPIESVASFDHPTDPHITRAALATARATGEAYSIDHRILTRTGETRWVQEQVRLSLAPDGTPVRMLGTAFDISDLKWAEDELYHQAHHDALTGLPNRRLLRDRLTATLESAATSGKTVALMYADLDRFKIVNDSLGHVAGDLLLQSTASRLLACVREGDTVARTGGDEFVLVISGVGIADAATTAARIVAACETPHTVEGVEIVVPLSIGIATYPRDGIDPDTLMRAADTAMYRAKEEGGSRVFDYKPGGEKERYERLGLETELRRAIAGDELVVHYQPITDRTQKPVVIEALVRWQHPTRGLLGPDRFIPIAEESGAIVALGDWVLRTASAEIRALQREGFAELRLAVNVSSKQFREHGYAGSVARFLAETGFDAGHLDLEITESVVMHDVEAAIETMRDLKAERIRISIDDFGTGYSSLAYLQRFPIDTLKIDRRFVSDLPANKSDVAIVESIVTLAHNLGLRVVAEGVETSAQFDLLARLHCDELQGYYIGKPQPVRDLRAWLASAHVVADDSSSPSRPVTRTLGTGARALGGTS